MQIAVAGDIVLLCMLISLTLVFVLCCCIACDIMHSTYMLFLHYTLLINHHISLHCLLIIKISN